MGDKIYKSKDGIVELEHDLPDSFERVESIKQEKKIDWKDLGLKAGLNGDDLKKYMKKNAEQKRKQLDKIGDN